MNLNKVFLVGRATQDPQLRVLPSGQNVVSFGLATDRFYFDKNKEKKQQTNFHNIVMFGRLADIASQYLTKGSLILIEGRIQNRSWKDSTGNQRWRTEIIAEGLQLGPKSAGKITPSAPMAENSPNKDKEEIPIIEEDEIDVRDIPL